MHLEIVSHCWKYSSQLTYQLSSLVLFPPQVVQVRMTVCYSSEDVKTVDTLAFFESIYVDNITWHWVSMEKSRLFRRSIGRNEAAIHTAADWIWFADADMCFRKGCLDDLLSQVRSIPGPLVFPKDIWISKDHEAGDTLLDKIQHPCVVDVNPAEFVHHHYNRAIGGVQIVDGCVARHRGYNKMRPIYMKPRDRFDNFTDDVAFRRDLGTEGIPIGLPNLFRIRHYRYGRRLAR